MTVVRFPTNFNCSLFLILLNVHIPNTSKANDYEGMCVTTPGPCDQNQKGCCFNTATGAQYCAGTDEERLSCDIAAPQGDESSPKCEFCGKWSQPCCFPSSMDASTATSWEVSMAPAPCDSDQAVGELACMLDKGSADDFNRCGCKSPFNQVDALI